MGHQIYRNFGMEYAKFYRKFWNEFLLLLFRKKFLGNFVPMKFYDKFGIGALGFSMNFGLQNIWHLFIAFFAPKLFEKFGMRIASSRDYTKR